MPDSLSWDHGLSTGERNTPTNVLSRWICEYQKGATFRSKHGNTTNDRGESTSGDMVFRWFIDTSAVIPEAAAWKNHAVPLREHFQKYSIPIAHRFPSGTTLCGSV
jgi:hypothetical protein